MNNEKRFCDGPCGLKKDLSELTERRDGKLLCFFCR